MISDLWYKNAVIYCLSVGTYMDANGDGVGDFHGLEVGAQRARLKTKCSQPPVMSVIGYKSAITIMMLVP